MSAQRIIPERAANIVLRPAAGHDLDAIVAIERAAFSDPWSAASFAGLHSNPRTRMTVADDGGRIVAYTVLMIAPPDADLANLAVAPLDKGRGIGKMLVADVIRAARAAGAHHVYLEVRESNARALAMYERAGFRTVGQRRRYYNDPVEDARVLRRELL